MFSINICSLKARLTAARTAAITALAIFMVFNLQLVQAVAGGPSGAGVQPEEKLGNFTCSQLLPGIPGLVELKVEPVADGTFSDGTLEVVIDVRNTGSGPVFDWDQGTSGAVMQGVFVKGGPGGNLYEYNPPIVTSDTGLHAPINPNNDRFFGLSHISFCYTPGAPSIDVTKSCAEQTVNVDTVTTRNTVAIKNDGDFVLDNIQLKETIAALTCQITKVGGAAVGPVALPLDTFVTVPNGGTFDGDLAVDETVNVEVTCHDGALNLSNTIVASGESDFGTVDDTATNNPGAECPFSPNPLVDLEKDCGRTRLQQELLEQGNLALVVEVCPTITVTNTSATEPLSSAIVTDALIPALAAGVDVGPLAPGGVVDLATFLGSPTALCYQPTAAEQGNVDPGDGVKWEATTATFRNTATVEATGQFGGFASDSDSAQCPLCIAP